VHGKGALIDKLPGDDWQRFANLRLIYGYMYSQPGKKLLFMGGEFAQWREWNHDESLDWHLTQYERHQGMQKLIGDLNRLYATEPALHALDTEWQGFQWIEASDAEQSVLLYLRKGQQGETMLVACNFTPVTRFNYRVGVPSRGLWAEALNTDAREYGGSGQGNFGGVEAAPIPFHGHDWSVVMTLPPLGVVFLKAPTD
jgi:1,4-alpha-glucan branching enzyme